MKNKILDFLDNVICLVIKGIATLCIWTGETYKFIKERLE